MHPRYFLKTVASTWRRHGAWAACQVGLEQLVNGWMFFEWLHVIELRRPAQPVHLPARSAHPRPAADGPLQPDGLTTRIADEPALRALQREGGWGIDDTKLALMRAGDTCILSLVGGRTAGYTWVHTKGRPEIRPGLRLQLPDGALYNFAGFTHPVFRGSGLQSRRHEAVWAQPCWAHWPTMLGYVKATNFDSRRGQSRSGYFKIGSVLMLGSQRRFLALLSPSLRRRGLRRVHQATDQATRGLHLLNRWCERAWIPLASHTLAPWWHRRLLRKAERSNHHTYSCFYRAPAQLQALSGPVLDHLGLRRVPGDRQARPLRVLLYACSNGAEAYTWSAWLAAQRPNLEVLIEASDLHPEMVERAREGRYTWEEVTRHQEVPEAFLSQVFDRDGDVFVVNERTRSRVRFSCADIVQDDLRTRYGQADIVLAQNVLVHLPPTLARRAFDNIVDTLLPTGALFIEGMDHDLRAALTAARGLRPLAWHAREIYDASRSHTPSRWWSVYDGAEPWRPWRREPLRRYGSIFLQGVANDRLPSQVLAA